MQPLTGLDRAFLALETATAHFHVGAVLVLDPPVGEAAGSSPAERFARIRTMVGSRLHLVPQFRQRAFRLPLDLLPPLWVDDPAFDLDDHLRRASLPAPGGPAELDELVADLMARPLAPDRPLWEMVVVEGLAGDRTALVAKLHHAIIDGVSGASTMATLLDLEPEAPAAGRADAAGSAPWDPKPLPSAVEMAWRALATLAHQPEAVVGALQTGADALVEVSEHNRRLAEDGLAPPPPPFDAPRTLFNGSLSSGRRYAHFSVPLADINRLRRALPAARSTFNDVVLCAVGLATDRYLERHGELPGRPLVALVPVSTRRAGRSVPADPPGGSPEPPPANQVSGMLIGLGMPGTPPLERLTAIAGASRVAKEQEQLAWGRLLEGVARATPHAVAAWAARGSGFVRLFDRVPPLCNVAVSTVPGPDVPLWVAGLPVTAAYPVGPVAHGVGLNVTTMTYDDTVHFGLLACRRRVPDLDELAMLLRVAVTELCAVAGVAGEG